jgi:transposase-like protein
MPRPYPPEFRQRALDLVRLGRSVAKVAGLLGIAASCLYRWKKQDRIDRGLEPGTSRAESAELIAARQKSRDLDRHRQASRPGHERPGHGHRLTSALARRHHPRRPRNPVHLLGLPPGRRTRAYCPPSARDPEMIQTLPQNRMISVPGARGFTAHPYMAIIGDIAAALRRCCDQA